MPTARYREVFENNQRWIQNKLNKDADFFNNMAKGQNPDFLYIGCADSRVPASEVMGLDPGDVFVHRNVANVVENTDLNCQSVIEYAVSHLEVKYVVVCGHYGCGGVKAAMQQADLGLLNGWLRNIRDVYRLHAQELDAIEDEYARYDRLVELNVQEQCINVIKTVAIQKSFGAKGFPTVHGWVYDLKSGKLVDLEIDFDAIMKDIQKIYSII